MYAMEPSLGKARQKHPQPFYPPKLRLGVRIARRRQVLFDTPPHVPNAMAAYRQPCIADSGLGESPTFAIHVCMDGRRSVLGAFCTPAP